MNVLRKEVPDIYKEIKSTEDRMRKRAEDLQKDQQKLLQDNIPMIHRAWRALEVLPEEERQDAAVRMSSEMAGRIDPTGRLGIEMMLVQGAKEGDYTAGGMKEARQEWDVIDPPGELDTAEVNLAWKSLASTGKMGGEFTQKTKNHLKGVTQKEAQAREEVGKAGIYELKPLSHGTDTQKGAQEEAFRVKEVAGKMLFHVYDKLEKVLTTKDNAGATMGLLGTLNRFGGEVSAFYSAIAAEAKASGIQGFDDDVKNADIEDFQLSDEIRNYAAQSAANKSNLLTLGLLYASATGMGQGRALTDRDLQRALTAIGDGTGDIDQFIARMNENKDNINQKLVYEASIYSRDNPWFHSFKGLYPEEQEAATEAAGLPEGFTQELWDLLSDKEKGLARE